MKTVLAILFIAIFEIHSLPTVDDPLEPSVENEVDHALSLAETWLEAQTNTVTVASVASNDLQICALQTCVSPTNDIFHTNGLSRTEIALKLLQAQRSDGWWITQTNTMPTKVAVEILKGLY